MNLNSTQLEKLIRDYKFNNKKLAKNLEQLECLEIDLNAHDFPFSLEQVKSIRQLRKLTINGNKMKFDCRAFKHLTHLVELCLYDEVKFVNLDFDIWKCVRNLEKLRINKYSSEQFYAYGDRYEYGENQLSVSRNNLMKHQIAQLVHLKDLKLTLTLSDVAAYQQMLAKRNQAKPWPTNYDLCRYILKDLNNLT